MLPADLWVAGPRPPARKDLLELLPLQGSRCERQSRRSVQAGPVGRPAGRHTEPGLDVGQELHR